MLKATQVISAKCKQCSGKCYDSNQTKRQANSLKMFGIVPNACVDSEINGCQCPFIPK